MFAWSEGCQNAFETVKSLLMSALVLATPKGLILAVDASDDGIGAVFVQEDSKGVDHPIGYFLHKFNASQRNYLTSEKEALALVYALQHFNFYVNPTR